MLLSEKLGSLFGLIGAVFLSFNMAFYGFIAFFISNLFFVVLGYRLNLKAFLWLQGAFTFTSLTGIYNNI